MAFDNIPELVQPFWHQAAILGDTCQCASIHGTEVPLCKLKLPIDGLRSICRTLEPSIHRFGLDPLDLEFLGGSKAGPALNRSTICQAEQGMNAILETFQVGYWNPSMLTRYPQLWTSWLWGLGFGPIATEQSERSRMANFRYPTKQCKKHKVSLASPYLPINITQQNNPFAWHSTRLAQVFGHSFCCLNLIWSNWTQLFHCKIPSYVGLFIYSEPVNHHGTSTGPQQSTPPLPPEKTWPVATEQPLRRPWHFVNEANPEKIFWSIWIIIPSVGWELHTHTHYTNIHIYLCINE